MEIFKHLHSRVDQNTVKADASLSIAMLGFNFLEPHYFSLQHLHWLLGQKSHARQVHDVRLPCLMRQFICAGCTSGS